MPNVEAKTPLTFRRDGKGKIWSPVRQAWFVEFPEEVVRQEFVCRLVNDYGYALDQMGEELEVQRGRQSAEADLVIWRTAQDKRDAKPPLIVVECKADNVTISPKDYAQGESYARIVDAPFFVTHNNRETRYWRVKKDRMPGGGDERDRARFQKMQSYMVLLDDKVECKNTRCRRRFEVSGIKTMAFLDEPLLR